MAVSKSENAAELVERRREINPFRITHSEWEARVVEGVWAFFQQNPETRRRRRYHFRGLPVSPIRQVAAMIMMVVQPRAIDREAWLPRVAGT